MAYPDDSYVFVVISNDGVNFGVETLWSFNQIWAARGWYIVAYIPPPGTDPAVFLATHALWRDIYSAGATYSLNQVVRAATGDLYIALTGPITGVQPDLNPVQWALFLKAGAAANTVLSRGDVGGGFGGSSGSSTTPAFVDVPGCVVAPNVVTPVAFEIAGELSLAATPSTDTQYRIWFQIVDDLGVVVGGAVRRIKIGSTTSPILAFFAKIEPVTPAIAGRTYKLQAAMSDASGGSYTLGGALFGGAANLFRLVARPS